MAKKKSKGVSALMKINRRAKQIVAYSGGSYRVAHKKASAEYRADHKPKARKKTIGKVKKKVHRKKIGAARREVGRDRADNKRVNVTIGNVSAAQAKSIIRSSTKERLKDALYSRDIAKTKTARRNASKKVSSLRQQLRNYQ